MNVVSAASMAQQYALKAYDNLKSSGADNTIYFIWFGSFDPVIYNQVVANFKKINETDFLTWTYDHGLRAKIKIFCGMRIQINMCLTLN